MRRQDTGQGIVALADLVSGRAPDGVVPHPASNAAADEAAPPCPDLTQDRLFERKPRARPQATATQRALGLLTRREHSRKELTRKLTSRGVDPAEVAAAVDRLSDAGWQDEARFAASLVRARAAAGYGPVHIRAELGTHDLPAEVREAAFEAFDGDWLENATDLARRRVGRIEDARTRERKAVDLLLRRGFSGDIARAAARALQDPD